MVAKRLKELRIEKGLSQKELSELTGIPQATIARYELGKTEPIASTIVTLCDFFGVSADYLIGRQDW